MIDREEVTDGVIEIEGVMEREGEGEGGTHGAQVPSPV